MIKIERLETMGWRPAIRGMRNPMNSWDKSDSDYRMYLGKTCDECVESEPDLNANKCDECWIGKIKFPPYPYVLGPEDLGLASNLAKLGGSHSKFRRMIVVYCDITAPLYFWKDFDTYKVGTVSNSCSTMHKVMEKKFTKEDFSCEHLNAHSMNHLLLSIDILNDYRYDYLKETDKDKKKDIWWQVIQSLPSSYNQKRTIMLNYEVASRIVSERSNHKQDEWRELCEVFKTELPYAKELITCNV